MIYQFINTLERLVITSSCDITSKLLFDVLHFHTSKQNYTSKEITRKSGHRCASLTCNTWISCITCMFHRIISPTNFVRYHWLSLVIIGYHRLSLIIIDFHWFSLIIWKYEIYSSLDWQLQIKRAEKNQGMLAHLKIMFWCKFVVWVQFLKFFLIHNLKGVCFYLNSLQQYISLRHINS